jgi:hypothetical protein
MTDQNVALIRMVEHTVLDQAHKRYALVKEPLDVALRHILRVALHILRSKKNLSHLEPVAAHLWLAQFLKAVSFALRWAYLECPRDLGSTATPSEKLDEAAQYLIFEWGMPYVELAADHIAWSNGLMPAEIIESERLITFGPAPSFDIAGFSEQYETEVQLMGAEFSEFPSSEFQALFNEWQQHAKWTAVGLEFDPAFVRLHSGFHHLVEWMSKHLFRELDDSVSLGMYSLGELRHFLAVALGIARCIETLESAVDDRLGPNKAMGSWIFAMSAKSAVRWYAAASAMSEQTVEAMLDDLTGDLSRFHFSVAATPIVRFGDEVLIGQRLLAALRPAHFVARALTVGSGRKRYDHVSTLLERARLDVIEARLRNGGIHVLREQSFARSGNIRFAPDLVLWDDSRTTVVIIDFKNSLSATGAADVVNRMREYRKGVAQIERYLKHFREEPALLTKYVGAASDDLTISGGLLFWTPLALPIPRHAEIVLDSWPALLARVGSDEAISLDDLRPKLGGDVLHGFSIEPRDLCVGEWHYRRFRWYKPQT